MAKVCLNSFNCKNTVSNSANWCAECHKNLTLYDKFYVIGLIDAWPVTTTATKHREAYEAYELGVADRLGVPYAP